MGSQVQVSVIAHGESKNGRLESGRCLFLITLTLQTYALFFFLFCLVRCILYSTSAFWSWELAWDKNKMLGVCNTMCMLTTHEKRKDTKGADGKKVDRKEGSGKEGRKEGRGGGSLL